MLMAFLLLGLVSLAACAHGCTPVEPQPVVTTTGNPLERYTTQPSIQRQAPISWHSSSQQSIPVDTASILAQVPSVDPAVACWNTPFCESILADFAYCYNMTGSITDPNADDGRSEIYQRCLCNGRGNMYKDIIVNHGKVEKDNMMQCYECMKQAGVDTEDIDQPSMQLEWKIHDFCNTAAPNLYDLLFSFLVWLRSTKVPVDHDNGLGGVSAILTLANRFTSTSGMNQATRMTSLPTSTQGGWPPSSRTSDDAKPTQYLQQLPKNWPYTAYGVARKAGQTTSYPLTDPNSMGVTMAWLYYKMAWNPRPLFTPASAGNAMYQPALQEWVPSFLTANTWSMATNVSTTGFSTEVLDPIATPATPASDGQVSFGPSTATIVAVMITSSSSSFVVTTSPILPIFTSTFKPITRPITLPTPSTSSSPSSTSPRSIIFWPSYYYKLSLSSYPAYHQETVLSQTPNAGDVTTAHMGDETVEQETRQEVAMEDLWGEIERVSVAIRHAR